MTITDPSTHANRSDFAVVTVDLYRDIHKGIRAELFAVTTAAGRVDPADRAGRVALADRVTNITRLLVEHAEHEDNHVQSAIETHMPALAEQIAADHVVLEARMAELDERAASVVAAAKGEQAAEVHRLYMELASFTAAYLQHQDVEERVVMPALEVAVGVPAVVGIHGAIIASIPPAQMATSLALMLPAMNIDNRVELLGGMRAGAPAEVFEGVWGLTGTVLAPADFAALGDRLGITAGG